jgi:hypothetical protein
VVPVLLAAAAAISGRSYLSDSIAGLAGRQPNLVPVHMVRQPPLTVAEWTAEIRTMRDSFGTPIPSDQIDELAHYLADGQAIEGRRRSTARLTDDLQ